MLNSIFSSVTSSISIGDILLSSFVSIILGILIAFTNKITSKYNKNFLITISILPLLVATVIIMVNGNLGTSVAIVGAFSLVRFRSIPGTSKEIISVFFAMAVGLATGMGQLVFAAILTVSVSLMLIILSKTKFGEVKKQTKILRITLPDNLDYTEVFDDIFATYVKSYTLEKVKTTNLGSLFELTYLITIKKDINEKEFIDELRSRNGNLKIILTHPLENNEL